MSFHLFFSTVQDILYVIKTIDTCNEIRDGMRKALNTWKPKENHTNYLFREVVDLKDNVTAASFYMAPIFGDSVTN